VIGNTTEIGADGERLWSVFVCGEWGYFCPLIQTTQIDVSALDQEAIDEICYPLLPDQDAPNAPPPANKKRKTKPTSSAIPAHKKLRFGPKSQGDLLRGHTESTAPPTAKRRKSKKQVDEGEKAKRDQTPEAPSVEIVIHWKFYCNAKPTKYKYRIDLAEGVHESLCLVTFSPTNGPAEESALQVLQTFTKPLAWPNHLLQNAGDLGGICKGLVLAIK